LRANGDDKRGAECKAGGESRSEHGPSVLALEYLLHLNFLRLVKQS
jgi:hypothetical protein